MSSLYVRAHLGHTEIFCRHTTDPETEKAVQEWLKKVAQRAIDGCFSVPSRFPLDIVGPRVSNYHIWFGKLKQAFDPNGVGELTGFSYVGADTAGAHTLIYKKQPEEASPKQ